MQVIGTILLFAGKQTPVHWLECTGALLDSNQNYLLQSVVGYTYGGSSTTTFRLPKLDNKYGMRYLICREGHYGPGRVSYDADLSGRFGEGIMGFLTPFKGGDIPSGWALCDGRELKVGDNSALFSIIGATYGGDAPAYGAYDGHTFKLPKTDKPYIICTSGQYPSYP